MNKETLEHISSLMDGELSRETGLFLTRRLTADQELTGTWERYHLIRDCIRQPGTGTPVVDLSQRMKDALSEDAAGPKHSWSSNRWLKPLSGFAIAASVALMAIVAIGPGQSPQDTDLASTPAVQQFASPNVLPATPNTEAASFSLPSQRRDARLNSYLLRHNQASVSIISQGFLGFVPIVSSAETDESQGEEPGIEEADEVLDSAETDAP